MRAALDKLQRRIEMFCEKRRAAAVISQGCHRRKGVLIAQKTAKACFHAPDRKQRAGRDAVTLFKLCEECRIGLLERAPARNDPVGPALGHEGIERQLEAVLAPVGADGSLRIARAHEGGNRLGLHPVGLCLDRKAFLPRFKTTSR